jgi:hypothetical protein
MGKPKEVRSSSDEARPAIFSKDTDDRKRSWVESAVAVARGGEGLAVVVCAKDREINTE